MAKRSFFTTGGTVQAGGGRYVHRRVDDELLALCRSGTFGFVLTARQMGKSSLMVQTAQRLAEIGTRSVIIDLSQIGTQVTPEEWYLGLLTTIEDALDLDTDMYEWWEEHTQLGSAQRMARFFQEVMLQEVEEPVVIFIDEIDTTLSLPFTDDFFAAIRSIYNARSSEPVLERLSFVLIGVATPNDLISDPKRTPFNIGKRVDVNYFTAEEARPLADGFGFAPGTAQQALGWVLDWTSGHPYLTQRLCRVIAEQHSDSVTRAEVDRVVADTFFGEKSEQDSNLRFVHDMLTRRAEDPTAVLTTYEQVLKGRKVLDDKQSPAVTHLKLSGVVGRTNNHLVVQNKIYAQVFNPQWVKEQWPEHWIKRVPPAVVGLVAASFVAVILLGLVLLQTQRATQAVEQTELQEELNETLTDQLQTIDSLNTLTRAANVQLQEQLAVVDSLNVVTQAANVQLSEQFQVTDGLHAEAQAANVQLQEQFEVADSLRTETEGANAQLSVALQEADSLRTIAEVRLEDARRARQETLTIALASKAVRQLKLGDAQLGALLARQAYRFSQSGEGEFLDPIYDALLQTLNALDPTGAGTAGGPAVMSDYEGGVRSVAYSPDGRWIATADDGGTIGLTETSTLAVKQLGGHKAGVRTLAFSADGTRLATGGDDFTIQVWRNLGEDKPERETVGQHEGGVWTVAFSPNGTRLASAGADGTLRIWDLAGSGDPVSLTLQDQVRVRTLAFSPDGNLLGLGGENGTLQLWAWNEAGTTPQSWDAEQGRLLTLAFSPDGRLLASGGDDARVRLWSLSQPATNPALERELRGHEGPINAVAFSADGAAFASGSADHSVQVWDASNFETSPLILQDHASWVWSLAFSPDGRQLASASADRTVRVWNIQPDRLARQICRAVGERELSAEEWDRYVGEDFLYERDYALCSASTADVQDN